MRGNVSAAASAYMFVLMIMLTLFLLITVIASSTIASRRISAHYIQFGGLYDLALANSERTLLLLKQEQDHNSQEMIERVHERLLNEGIEAHLVFDENFYLGVHFWQMFIEEKESIIDDFITNSFGHGNFTSYSFGHPRRFTLNRYFSYILGVAANRHYEVRTYIGDSIRYYRVISTARKVIDGHPGVNVRVYGLIQWPNLAHQVMVQPLSFTWRDEPPNRFREGTYLSTLATFGDFGTLVNLNWEPENAVYPTLSTFVNVGNFSGIPTLIIHNNPSVLYLYGGSTFNGIIVSAGDVIAENMTVRGSVIANGSIYAYNTLIESDPYILFSIPMDEGTMRTVFDFLKITSFADATNRTEDVLQVLNDIKIVHFDLDEIPLIYFVPQLTMVQQIAN